MDIITWEVYEPYMQPPKNWLTVEETAEVLSVHTNTVFRAIQRGELQAEKIGRGYRIRPAWIEDYKKSKRIRKEEWAA